MKTIFSFKSIEIIKLSANIGREIDNTLCNSIFNRIWNLCTDIIEKSTDTNPFYEDYLSGGAIVSSFTESTNYKDTDYSIIIYLKYATPIPGKMLFTGGKGGFDPQKSQGHIYININPSFDSSVFTDKQYQHYHTISLLKCISHELSHVFEGIHSQSKLGYNLKQRKKINDFSTESVLKQKEIQEKKLKDFHSNIKSEVEAHTTSIITELEFLYNSIDRNFSDMLNNNRHSLSERIMNVLNCYSRTWRNTKDNLTPKSKKYIISKVTTYLLSKIKNQN